MTMTKTMLHAATATTGSWSGIDAGRREQVDHVFTNFRHFRRSRWAVKRGSGLVGPMIELRGNADYLRALRRAEMRAWQESGGDYYRPAKAAN